MLCAVFTQICYVFNLTEHPPFLQQQAEKASINPLYTTTT